MPVIAIANPKGGAGKSTLALVLGTTIAAGGASVSLLDCDPNHPIATWAGMGRTRSSLRVRSDITESTIIGAIDAEQREHQLVIVDLEGTASKLAARAISRADLVLVPMQASPVDEWQAVRAIELVKEEEQVVRRAIPMRLAFTRTSPAIATRIEKAIMRKLEQYEIPKLARHLNERAAYKSMFENGLDLSELDAAEVNGLEQALANARELANEVVDLVASLTSMEEVA